MFQCMDTVSNVWKRLVFDRAGNAGVLRVPRGASVVGTKDADSGNAAPEALRIRRVTENRVRAQTPAPGFHPGRVA